MKWLEKAMLLVLLFGCVALPVTAQVPAAALKPQMESFVNKEYPDLDKLYKYLHSHPELSFQEKNTSARIAAELRKLGFQVTEHVGGYGVVGVFRNGKGPTVMIRTDMDALPIKEKTGLPYASTVTATDDQGRKVPVMHACGHDIHMTVFVGTARLLTHFKNHWSGTLVMIGQPAEERGAGARAMIADGLFKRFPRPDYAIALHDNAGLPAGKVAYTKGYALANVDAVDIIIHGVGGHGAYPQTTKDPIVMAAETIMMLQTIVSREISPQDPAVVTVGSIHGGTKHNIIPDEVKMQLTLRSYTMKVRNHIISAIKRMTRGIAEANGIPKDKMPEVLVKDEFTPATYNDPQLMDRLAKAFRAVIGKQNVIEQGPVMGGEDFGQYGRVEPKIPIGIFWLGAVDPQKYREHVEKGIPLPSLHSPFFAPLPEPTIKTGVMVMSAAALQLLGRR